MPGASEHKVWVQGLKKATTNEQFSNFVAPYRPKAVVLIQCTATGGRSGQAILVFRSEGEAQQAIMGLDGRHVGPSILRVSKRSEMSPEQRVQYNLSRSREEARKWTDSQPLAQTYGVSAGVASAPHVDSLPQRDIPPHFALQNHATTNAAAHASPSAVQRPSLPPQPTPPSFHAQRKDSPCQPVGRDLMDVDVDDEQDALAYLPLRPVARVNQLSSRKAVSAPSVSAPGLPSVQTSVTDTENGLDTSGRTLHKRSSSSASRETSFSSSAAGVNEAIRLELVKALYERQGPAEEQKLQQEIVQAIMTLPTKDQLRCLFEPEVLDVKVQAYLYFRAALPGVGGKTLPAALSPSCDPSNLQSPAPVDPSSDTQTDF